MKMKKLILLTLFIVVATSAATATYSLTVTAENSDGELVTADEMCVNNNCVEREFSHTFSVSENQDTSISISDSEYRDIETSEYVFADMEKTYTLQQIDQKASLTVEAVNQEGEYVTADEICIDGSCVEKEFKHTVDVDKDQEISVSIEDSEYDNVERTLSVSGDTTKTYELTRTDTRGSLEVYVEDNDGMNGKAMEDVQVTLGDAVNRGPKYTNSNGEVTFNDLPANTDIDIQVKCYGKTENKYNVEVDSGKQKNVEVNFDESFESSVCGEDTDDGPTAHFSIDDKTPEVEQWVNFDASDSDGNIRDYNWDFGDGDTYTDDDPKVSHRYNDEGEFTVELTVEEHDGDEDTKTKTVNVEGTDEDNSAPEVDLRRPSDHQTISLPYSLRWDVSDPDSDEVESTVFIAEERNDESSLDDEYLIRENVGDNEYFRLDESDLDEGDYMWGVKAEDEHGKDTWSNVRSFEVESETERDGNARLNVLVEDEDGDSLNAGVIVDNGNWFSQDTGSDGEASFEVQSGTVDVTVSKDGYETETQSVNLDSGEEEDLSFTLRERYSDPDQARLDIHVEDNDYNELEDAKVTVENGDRKIKYTDWDGDARFYLDSDDYNIEVECNGEEEYRDVYLSEGEREDIDIRFDEDFDSDTCGEDGSEDRDDDDSDDEGLEITDVSYPNSVCRGGSFSVNMRIQNHGGFHELVTITGSGLGSISTGQSFALDVAEIKSATLRFTNVEGSGAEEFEIRATNHVSDQTTETVDVRDCGDQLPDYDGDGNFDSGTSTGVTAEVSPKKTVVGNAVKVKGYVDGVRGRSQVTVTANGERKASVSTEPDGYYSTYIRLDEVGDNIVRVRSGGSEISELVTAVPTSTVSRITAPNKVFEAESFEVCANIDSQVEPQVFLSKNNKVVDSKYGNGEVCFSTEASETGEHEYQIETLTYGKKSSSTTETVNILELGNEITNFPDQVATTESEEGMVKVELYNTNNETRNYKVKLNGIRTDWLSQSQEDVILTKGEKETVYFYLTPQEEGNFEPTVTVVSEDTTIYSEELSVYAGGTKNSGRTSFFDRLSQFFNF